MIKRTVKDKDGNIIEDKEMELPVNDKRKDKKQEKRKDTKVSKESQRVI